MVTHQKAVRSGARMARPQGGDFPKHLLPDSSGTDSVLHCSCDVRADGLDELLLGFQRRPVAEVSRSGSCYLLLFFTGI